MKKKTTTTRGSSAPASSAVTTQVAAAVTSAAPAVSAYEELAPGIKIVKAIKNKLFKNTLRVGESCIIVGLVRNCERDSGNYGDFWGFDGDFAAKVQNAVFKSGRLFMPDVAANLVASGFLAVREAELVRVEKLNEENRKGNPDAEEIEPKKVTVEFKLRLRKVADASSTTGFVWQAEPLEEIKPESDKVLALLPA